MMYVDLTPKCDHCGDFIGVKARMIPGTLDAGGKYCDRCFERVKEWFYALEDPDLVRRILEEEAAQ
jgi:hypothetical protein